MVALGTVGWAASFGWPMNGLVEMFIIVLVVGSGVDYCLFLFARFREELSSTSGGASVVRHGDRILSEPRPLGSGTGSITQDRFLTGAAQFRKDAAILTHQTRRAVEAALTHSGPAILAAAGTVAVGLATLFLARNRDLYTSGPTIAFAIGVAALAVLTLTPSLMRVGGLRLISLRCISRFPEPKEGAFWRAAAHVATRFPLGVTAAMIAVLLPTSIVGTRVPSLYDTYEEYPADSSFVRGARLYSKHFFDSQGVSEMTLVLSTDARLDTAPNLVVLRATLDRLHATLTGRFPLVYQRDVQDPLGSARSHPETSPATVGAILSSGVADRLARDAYIARSGTATRIDLGVRVEPRTVASMELVDHVRALAAQIIEQSGLRAATGAAHVAVDVAGESAAYADMRQLRTRDFRVIAVAACTLIYLILVGLIRSPMQAVILLAATLVTYLATYGATYLIVHAIYGLNGLSWQINFLLFIIIMSLGQDYNIFVVARIHEELRTRPPREAIEIAIRKTGRVVSGCGVIMAATFASMFSGSLLVLKEFAIALPLGILIDTFIVRPLLVPAVILLLYEWTPARRRHARAAASAAAAN